MSATSRGWTRVDRATGRWMIREVDTFTSMEEVAAFVASHGDCRITVDGERVTTEEENLDVELSRGERRLLTPAQLDVVRAKLLGSKGMEKA